MKFLTRRAAGHRRASASRGKRGPAVRPRGLVLEPLETRLLLAILTNGTSATTLTEGQLFVQVNEQGAFGTDDRLDVNAADRPVGNAVGDATYNPAVVPGGTNFPAAGTTFLSVLAVGNIGLSGTAREFMTAGTSILGSPPNVNGQFGLALQSNNQRTSTFFYPNNVTNPADAMLRFELTQQWVDLSLAGSQSGTSLIQTYTVTNLTGEPLSFDIIRYYDGDLVWSTNSFTDDGGGKQVFDVTSGAESVFMTATATGTQLNDPTFVEVRNGPNTPGIPPLPRPNRWEVFQIINPDTKQDNDLLQRIRDGGELQNAVVPATQDDAPANEIVDAGGGGDFAVALRNVYENVLQPFAYTVITQFGNPRIGTPPPPPPTTIQGVKFADLDGDGVRDADEPGLAGWTIFLDENGNGTLDVSEASTRTGSSGQYSFRVSPGDYVVAEVLEPNWTQTFPAGGTHDVTVALGEVATADFGNRPDPGEIRGIKWADENRNGVRDAGELGLPGWTIFVDANNNSLLDLDEISAVTAADGSYVLASVPFGTQIVREVMQPSYEQTFPSGNGTQTVSVGAGQIVSGVNFGNRLKDSGISGVKWHDLNGNGLRDPGEPGLAGFVIYVDLDNDGVIGFGEPAGATTADGSYQIRELRPGVYTVREQGAPGWVPTFPAGGAQSVTLLPGAPAGDVNFGNLVARDLGDAPAPYPTLSADNGAAHGYDPLLLLGTAIDYEPDGQPHPQALGDDLAGADDEDGVQLLTTLLPGATASVRVTASRSGVLTAWIDFNADGDWRDAGEQILVDRILTGGTNDLNFTVPATATVGPTYARFRMSHEFGLSFDGPAEKGEVEDDRVYIGAPPASELPAAVDDSLTAVADSSDTPLAVLANDFTPPGGILVITAVSPTSAGGTVFIAEDRLSLVYTPQAGFTGTETFTYTVDDGLGRSDTATVTVTVSPALAAAFRNPQDPLDVSGDRVISPIDALLVINDLNSGGPRQLPRAHGEPGAPLFMVDVNGDGFLSPLDALMVINHLNSPARRAAATEAAEGESPADGEAESVWLAATSGGLNVDLPTTQDVQRIMSSTDLPVAARPRGLGPAEPLVRRLAEARKFLSPSRVAADAVFARRAALLTLRGLSGDRTFPAAPQRPPIESVLEEIAADVSLAEPPAKG